MDLEVQTTLPPGRQLARTRWQTHESGAVFDRKKTPYLTAQAQEFIAQQSFCVIAGLGPQGDLCGLIAPDEPGFVQTPDTQTCILQLSSHLRDSRIVQRLRHCVREGQTVQLGLFFICHPTRERLCVQGTARLLSDDDSFAQQAKMYPIRIQLDVREAFFHCVKYIKTHVAGLTIPITPPRWLDWHPQQLSGYNRPYMTEEIRVFIEQQILCFLCTIGEDGQCAVNHRGGARKFLVALPPTIDAPGGTILLPDYTGNGAFEAVGNILETGRGALVIPNYAAQLAIMVSGTAQVVELAELAPALARRCHGAERVVILNVLHVETQQDNWSAALAYERTRAEALWEEDNHSNGCPL